MVVHRLWEKLNIKMNRAIAWLLTFNFVTMTWVFFRAKTWADAGKVLRGMTGFSGIPLPRLLEAKLPFLHQLPVQFIDIEDFSKKTLALILGMALVLFAKNSVELQKEFKPSWKNAAFCLVLLAIGIISLTKVSEFIYFNF